MALSGEKSPYLLMHANNPVDWYPWGLEAFSRAREEDKPVFLSIGRASCRWCRAMEKECFSDAEVAMLLNDACVCVKVDGDERPDLEALFMETCVAQNGSGGSPLNLFLTPEGEPFFAATYLPKRTTGKMPGLADVTPRVKWLWLTRRDDVVRGARNLVDAIKMRAVAPRRGLGIVKAGAAQARFAMNDVKDAFDPTWGGFSGSDAQKHPHFPIMLFLLEQARRGHEPKEALSMVSVTLHKMWAGGIHDHLGGGCFRYALDERWVLPRFEKALRDQAMLLWVLAAAYSIDRHDFYRSFAEDVVRCVEREFVTGDSCFRTSLDAEGDGASYYCWTDEEVRSSLPSGDAGLFCAAYAVMPGGNFIPEMSTLQIGRNVIYEPASVVETARRFSLRPPEAAKRLENDRAILLKVRDARPAPTADDSVLMEDNGLMIGALARAGKVFEHPEWVSRAEAAASFLHGVLVDPKGEWRRRWADGEASVPALPGDYAAMIWGLMQLASDSQDAPVPSEAAAPGSAPEAPPRRARDARRPPSRRSPPVPERERHNTPAAVRRRDWSAQAEVLAAKLEEHFWDEEGGFFLSASDPLIFLRRKAAVDDAAPSANALAVMAYAALAEATEKEKEKSTAYLDKADAVSSCFARAVNAAPVDHISMIAAAMLSKDARASVKEAEKEADKEADQEKKADEAKEPEKAEERRSEAEPIVRRRRVGQRR
ncbi:MAG: thioredoxin domain-containing protein [Synergistaceae bacterium]|nr:thioredoxin domain-containing protein [Synergistaceae bacterium]